MGQQVTIAASQVDKERLGYCAISLTNLTADTEPSIVAGSKIEIGGALYEFTADETGTGWAGIGASNFVYFLITPSGSTCAWSYTTTAPTWDTAKQGYYTGGNRAFGFCWKDAGNLYRNKGIFTPWTQNGKATASNRLGKLWHMPLDNTTDRTLGGGALVPTAAASWYGSAITAWGVAGVPTDAKGVRVKVRNTPSATAAGAFSLEMAFSDNNSSTPSASTAHAISGSPGNAVGAGAAGITTTELDIPLNASGAFYMYTLLTVNVTVANCFVSIRAVGFYMGD